MMKVHKLRKNLSSSLLVLTIAFSIIAIAISEYSQVFADTNRHVVITEGRHEGNEYVMEAKGRDYYTHETHSGDWKCADLPGEPGVRLVDAWVKYYFKVPSWMYGDRQIKKIGVMVEYDKVDYADSGGSENAPPRMYCAGRSPYWIVGCESWANEDEINKKIKINSKYFFISISFYSIINVFQTDSDPLLSSLGPTQSIRHLYMPGVNWGKLSIVFRSKV